MAYEKHTWENGELITAEKLNNIENGIGDSSDGGGASVMVCEFTIEYGVFTIRQKYKEIEDFMAGGGCIFCIQQYQSGARYVVVSSINTTNKEVTITWVSGNSIESYTLKAYNDDSYPSYDNND